MELSYPWASLSGQTKSHYKGQKRPDNEFNTKQ